MNKTTALELLLQSEQDLEGLEPDLTSVSMFERTSRQGEVANLICAVRGIIQELTEDGDVPELESTVSVVRTRIKGLKDDPTSAGKHDEIMAEDDCPDTLPAPPPFDCR